MKVNIKRLLKPIACLGAGFFNFILMFLNFANVYVSSSDYRESEGFSGYATINFGDDSLGSALEQSLELFGKESNAGFMLALVSIALICMIIVSIGLLLIGAVGLVKELAKLNLLPFGPSDLDDRISKISLLVYFITTASASGLLLLSCLMNMYSGNFFGYKVSMGMSPDIGMFFLLLFALAAWLVPMILEKKLPSASQAPAVVCQCSACGAPATPNDRFCGFCGGPVIAAPTAPVNETSAEGSEDTVKNFDYAMIPAFLKGVWNKIKDFMEKKHIPMIWLYIACGVLALLIVGIIILVNIPWPQDPTYIIPERDIAYEYHATDDQTIIISNGEQFGTKIEGNVVKSAQSLNGKTMAMLTDDNTLYIYHDNNLINIDAYVYNFKLAVEGTAVAYINDQSELVLYTVADQTSETVISNLMSVDAQSYCISPDGKSVACAEENEESSILATYTGGTRTGIGENLFPLALSNNADLLYYYNRTNSSVYVLPKDGEAIKLINETASPQLHYNADHTQLVFSSDSGWYLSENGGEKQKISSYNIKQYGDFETWGLHLRDEQVIYAYTNPILNFKEQYFLDSSNTLYYIDDKLETYEVADSVESFQTTASASVIYYLDNSGELYRGKGYKEKFEMLADDVDAFVITANGEKCYYVDYDNTLRYVKGAKKSDKIADDVYGSVYITQDDYVLFMTDFSYSSGGTLYSSYDGKEKERISDDIAEVNVTATCTYYYCYATDQNGFDIFAATKETQFNRIVEGIIN